MIRLPFTNQVLADEIKLPSINIFLKEVEILQAVCHNNLQAKVSTILARSRLDGEMYRLTFVSIHDIKKAQKLISIYR
jgi:hypothetical protein